MGQFLLIAVLTFAYVVLQGCLRRTRMPVLWGLFLVVPLALTPYWIQTNDFDPFLWLKTYSIMFCVSWGTWLRFTSAGDKVIFRRTIAWLLAANIIEALTLDVLGHGTAHHLNAAAGILLLATMPWSVRGICIDRTSRHQDIRYDVPLAWIVGYTLWNWTFVYLNYPMLTGHHTAVLASALIVACFDPARWLQSRAATLGLNLLLMATSFSGTLAVHDASGWVNGDVAVVAAAVSFVWIAIHAMSKVEVMVRAAVSRRRASALDLAEFAEALCGKDEGEVTLRMSFSA